VKSDTALGTTAALGTTVALNTTALGTTAALVPMWEPMSRAPWDGELMAVRMDDLAEFCRRNGVTVDLGEYEEWEAGWMPVYRAREIVDK